MPIFEKTKCARTVTHRQWGILALNRHYGVTLYSPGVFFVYKRFAHCLNYGQFSHFDRVDDRGSISLAIFRGHIRLLFVIFFAN